MNAEDSLIKIKGHNIFSSVLVNTHHEIIQGDNSLLKCTAEISLAQMAEQYTSFDDFPTYKTCNEADKLNIWL